MQTVMIQKNKIVKQPVILKFYFAKSWLPRTLRQLLKGLMSPKSGSKGYELLTMFTVEQSRRDEPSLPPPEPLPPTNFTKTNWTAKNVWPCDIFVVLWWQFFVLGKNFQYQFEWQPQQPPRQWRPKLQHQLPWNGKQKFYVLWDTCRI